MDESSITSPSGQRARAGAALTALSFMIWGLSPIYWKALATVSPWAILAHRIIWSLVLSVALLTWLNRWGEVRMVLRSRHNVARLILTSSLLALNWGLYVWAVNHDQLLECSLGYYINPLVSMLLGFVFLRERMRRWQIVAMLLAMAGVANLVIEYERFPWIAFGLAGSFGVYGLLRKQARFESLPGMSAETALLFIPAMTMLIFLHRQGQGAFLHDGWLVTLLLIGAGLISGVPLLCFAYGVRRIRLATVGFLQYLGPTGMFLLGVFAYKEEFTLRDLATFIPIWVALGIYSWDSIMAYRRNVITVQRQAAD